MSVAISSYFRSLLSSPEPPNFNRKTNTTTRRNRAKLVNQPTLVSKSEDNTTSFGTCLGQCFEHPWDISKHVRDTKSGGTYTSCKKQEIFVGNFWKVSESFLEHFWGTHGDNFRLRLNAFFGLIWDVFRHFFGGSWR